MFKAIVVTKSEDGQSAEVTSLTEDQLPEQDVLIEVSHSTLNYKDGLAITGAAPILASSPMTPGIDVAGTVVSSGSPKWNAGDRVLVNGFGIGERFWGGMSQRVKMSSEWLVSIPDAFSPLQAMGIGTAGYTAMLCVMRLEQHGVTPDGGKILVTGATGGVGSVAVALLAKLGFDVVAATGSADQRDYLTSLGAKEIIDRAELAEAGPPLGAERWQAAIDTAGSQTLVNVLASIQYGGVVAATGLAHGLDLPGTMYPFIIRNVTLAGVDSVMQPLAVREKAWARLAADLDTAKLDDMIKVVGLNEAITLAPQILAGAINGRTVVDVNAD